MPLVIPHAFAAGTSINGANIEENNDVVKTYLNGNIVAGDVNAAQKWVTQPYVMTGFYNAIINQHEFATGMVQGAPELPKFQTGGSSIAIGDAVNTAARLESATKEQKLDLLIGESTAKKSDVTLEFVSEIHVKGKEQGLKVYTFKNR